MARSFVLLAACLAAMVMMTHADTCVSLIQSVGEGAPCNNVNPCKRDLYCSKERVCTKRKAIGDACDDACSPDNFGCECPFSSQCRGPEGGRICVKNANAGEKCTSLTNSTEPACGSGLTCESTGKICIGGQQGDACTPSTDAILKDLVCSTSQGCVNNICQTKQESTSCIDSNDCAPSFYCSADGGNGVCTKRKTDKTTCNSERECAFGQYCLGTSPTDERVCVANNTVEAGEFCDNFDAVCKETLTCVNMYCAQKRANRCASGNDCAADEFCSCNGISSAQLVQGSCKKHPCYDLKVELLQCMDPVCANPASDLSRAASVDNCVINFCKEKYDKYMECSPASALSVNVLFAAVLALLVRQFTTM